MRPGGFVDICEHCMKILGERNLESEEYKNVKKVNLFIIIILLFYFNRE